MRRKRYKIRKKGAYYHIVNHVSGAKEDLPFDDDDKSYAFFLIRKFLKLYCLDLISVCWMSNHFHIVLFAPGKPPSINCTASRFNQHYELNPSSCRYLDPAKNKALCMITSEKLIDISCFMKSLQQSFSIYFNRKHNRQGPVWKERFWSTILEGRKALWDCVKYVELNPVRAGIVEKPEDYAFSTWGRVFKNGKHPFESCFEKHMRKTYIRHNSKQRERVYISDVYSLFSEELNHILLYEKRLTVDAQRKVYIAAYKNSHSHFSRFLLRNKHWSKGLIIGSNKFVDDLLVNNGFESRSRKMATGTNSHGQILVSQHMGNICLATE